jgi:RND family efflux transporter MFP subunit
MKIKLIKPYFPLIALLLLSCSAEEKDIISSEDILRPLVKIEAVKQKHFIHEIRVQGNVESDKDILIIAEMAGLITSVKVKDGQTISQGQTIATIDASILSSNANELKTQLDYAEYMLEKQTELQQRGVGSEFDLETAKHQVESLKAKLNSLNMHRRKAIIRAPFKGVVDNVFARNGQMAGPQSPIIRLVNNKTVDIVATISEKHLSKIKVGTPISVSFPNFTDTTLDLIITNVGNYIEPTNRTFRIMATVLNNTLLLPNMLAEVSVTDMSVENGTVVPSKSILKDQNNHDFVYVAEKSDSNNYKIKKINVVVIEKYNGEALIESNLSLTPGQNIIVEGAKGITEKDIVRTK